MVCGGGVLWRQVEKWWKATWVQLGTSCEPQAVLPGVDRVLEVAGPVSGDWGS